MNGEPPPGGRAPRDEPGAGFDSAGDGPGTTALAALLGMSDMWAEPPAGEDALVALIASEVAASPIDEGPVSEDPRFRHRLIQRIAAAVIVLVAATGLVIGLRDDDSGPGPTADDVQLALAGTELAPDASASAALRETPVGLRIELDVSGLAPAPEGSYYRAWIGRPEAEVTDGVTAGSFHLRGGDGTVVLWAGVGWAGQGVLTITFVDADAPMGSDEVVVLRSS